MHIGGRVNHKNLIFSTGLIIGHRKNPELTLTKGQRSK